MTGNRSPLPLTPSILRTAVMIGVLVCHTLSGCRGANQVQVRGLPSAHAVRSDQLVLICDEKLPSQAETLAELRLVRRQVLDTFQLAPGERDVTVYLFSSRERYGNFMQETHPHLPARRAFFIGTPAELAVYAHTNDQLMVDLRHEYTHGLMYSAVGHVPLWLDEGIAEYFEVGGQTPGNINGEHVEPLSTAILNGWRPDLRRLEQLQDVHEMHRADYHEAWAWVHFLLHQAPNGREMISNYLMQIRYGETPVPLSQRLARELPDADRLLMEHIRRLHRGEFSANLLGLSTNWPDPADTRRRLRRHSQTVGALAR